MKFDDVVVLNSSDLIVKNADLDLNFNTLFQVPTKYVGQAIAMSRVFQEAINGNDLEFNFDKAIELVKKSSGDGDYRYDKSVYYQAKQSGIGHGG
ncbi:hypothetical protein DZS_12660 [Dickeya ananatis]